MHFSKRWLPSFVENTRHVLMKSVNLPVPPNVILVNIDVESLYTSIPNIWVFSAIAHFLDCHFPTIATQNKFLLELLQFALTNNCFQFMGTSYKQICGNFHGWALGTGKCMPSFYLVGRGGGLLFRKCTSATLCYG